MEAHPALTVRLRFEPLQPRHARLLFAALADATIYRYIPDEPHATVDSLARRYALLESGAPAASGEVWLNWAVQRIDDDAYIGTLQATVVCGARAYIGYMLAPPAWGHGFATEACRWLVGTLAQRFAVREILASVDVRNLRSARVLERAGFERIGTTPAHLRGEATTDFRYRLRCADENSHGSCAH